jgi:hypothetical protein
VSTSLLPVSYAAALELVPGLHSELPKIERPQLDLHSATATPTLEQPQTRYDLIIHVGVGSPGQIRLEQRPRRYGYEQADVEGELAPVEADVGAERKGRRRRGFVGREWDGAGDDLRTGVCGEKVVRYLKAKGVECVELSEDGGECTMEGPCGGREDGKGSLIVLAQDCTSVNSSTSAPSNRRVEERRRRRLSNSCMFPRES